MRYAERSIFITPESRVTILGDVSLPAEFGRAAFGFFEKHKAISRRIGLHEFMALFEEAVIFETLARSQGGQKEAARILGLKNTTLNMKIKRHNVRFSRMPL
jgi:transcriptional regulator with GAF, ATPase, and Fis domain